MIHAPEERAYSFETRLVEPSQLHRMTGLEIVERVRDGSLPLSALACTLGFRLVEAERGRAVVESEPGRHVYNSFGAAHGGFAASLLDSAMGYGVCTMLERGTGYTTIELGIRYVRPVLATSGLLRAESRVLHAGRRTATAEARLLGAADGRLYAHGSTTCLVFPLPPESGPAAAGPSAADPGA